MAENGSTGDGAGGESEENMRLIILLAASILTAQTTGTIVVTTLRTITATSGNLICTFVNLSPPAFDMECVVGGVSKLKQTATPAVGTGGVAGSYSEGAENVTWIVTQPSAGVLNWDIAAKGVRQTGSF